MSVTAFNQHCQTELEGLRTAGLFKGERIIATPQGRNNEGGPSSAPANGPDQGNHLHANPFPNTAAPGQTHECEAGNEDFLVGKTIVGNVPGNQGTVTQGQK